MEPWFLESQAFRASCNYELVLFTAAVMSGHQGGANGGRPPPGSVSVESLVELQHATEQEEENLQTTGVTFTYLQEEDEG